MLPMAGRYLTKLWDALKGVRGRALLAAAFMVVSPAVGHAVAGRGRRFRTISSFSADQAAAAEFMCDENTPEKAMILTGTQHNNPIAALTGRYIVCGTGSYLHFHGVDYAQNQLDAAQMLERPAESRGAV